MIDDDISNRKIEFNSKSEIINEEELQKNWQENMESLQM